jgi:hypothetical protein
MSKVRKAIVAGAGAAGAAVVAALVAGVPTTAEGWAALAGGAIGAGVLAGFAVWRTPNEGQIYRG